MNFLSDHLLLLASLELLLSVGLALAFRALPMLRPAMFYAAAAILLALFRTALPAWAMQVGVAALLLAATHMAFGFGLRQLTRDRVQKILVEILLFAGYAAVIAVALTRFGVNLTGLLATSAVATALVGLSMQESLSNLASGIFLQMERSINTGDWIQTGGSAGWVKYIRLRHTMIETADSDQILIPNHILTKSEVTIVSRRRRRLIPFLAPYGEMPTRIIDTVNEVLRSRKIVGIAAEPSPRCIVMEFQLQAMQMGVYMWMEQPDNYHTAISEAMLRIYFALSRIGVQVGLSPYLVETREAKPDAPHEEAGRRGPESAIAATELFRSLNEGELRTLVGRLTPLSFAPEEFIIRQGETGDSLYLIASGRVKVMVDDPERVQKGAAQEQVAELSGGSFFGEMSLLTGALRSATVIAITQVDCWRLRKAALEEIFNRRPELLRDVAEVLARRSGELAEARSRLSHENALRLQNETQTTLFNRITSFFASRQSR